MEREDGREGHGAPGGSRYRRVVQALVAANVVAAGVLVAVLLTGSDDTPEAVVSSGGPPPAATPAPPPGDPAAAPEGGLAAGGEGDASVTGAEGAGAEGAGAEGAPAAGTGATAATTPAGPDPAGGIASAFLAPPQEFTRVTDATAGTGPLDLEDVVRLDASDATLARSRFVELGFRSAHSRAWQTQTDSLLVVAYEFADDRGASTFVGEASALRRADPDATQLELPGVPGAAAFQLEIPGDPTQAVFLSRGPRAYLVGLVGPSAADPQAELLRRLAAAQYDAAL